MKKGPYKMKGYSYPGTSPMKKDKGELVKVKGQGKDYDGKMPEDYEILVTQEVKNLMDAGAPQSVIDAYKLKQEKEKG